MDRKALNYEVLKDTTCGMKLVLIIDSIVPRLLTRNPEAVYVFVRKLPSKAKRKVKTVIVVISLGVALCFSNVQSSEAMGLSVPPAPVVRVQPSYKHPSEVKIAKVITRKPDRISYVAAEEIFPLIYLTYPQVLSNKKIINELRGGSWQNIVTLGFLILIFAMSKGFVPGSGWDLDPPDVFQLPSTSHRFPPYYELFPRRTCSADRPESSLIMGRLQQQCNPLEGMTKEEIRNLPHAKDRVMNVEGRRQLTTHYGQARFKVKDLKKNKATIARLTEKGRTTIYKVLKNLIN